MTLTTEHLDLLEKLGGCFFSVKESAIVLEVPLPDLSKELKNSNSEAYKRYYKGWYVSELSLREALVKASVRGSNPSLKMLIDILTASRLENI